MKNGVKTALIISTLLGGVAGAAIQERLERPKIIENGAGHYDMMSGDFQWGKAPQLALAAITSNAEMSDALSNATRRSR